MEDFYNNLYLDYKNYIVANSIYTPNVYKRKPQEKLKLPTILFMFDTDRIDRENLSTDYKEYYSNCYFSIEIYTQNKSSIDKSIISDELCKLTNKYFINNLGMYKSNQEYNAPNIDANILRRIINYECKVGNKRLNIV